MYNTDMPERLEIIRQLQNALHLVRLPDMDVVEFEIENVKFSYDFTKKDKDSTR